MNVDQSDIAHRLHDLQAFELRMSLREFHDKLVEETGCSVSYTAARNYHDPDSGRMPSIEYLVAVSDACGVSLRWLIRGEPPVGRRDPTESRVIITEEQLRRIRDVLQEGLP